VHDGWRSEKAAEARGVDARRALMLVYDGVVIEGTRAALLLSRLMPRYADIAVIDAARHDAAAFTLMMLSLCCDAT